MALREMSLELGSDEHGFVIGGVRPGRADAPVIPDNTLLSWWADNDPDFASFLVRTGSQWGPFSVSVQVRDSEPGPAGSDWEDVVAVSVVTSEAVVIGEIVDGACGKVVIDPGPHRMRVSARGRTESAARDRSIPDDEHSDDGTEGPLEEYMIEFWPAEGTLAEVVREASKYARELADPAAPVHPPERDAGLAAAWTIVRDLQSRVDGREVPGDPVTVTVNVEVPGTPVRIFNRVRDAFGWPPCIGGMISPDSNETQYFDATLPDDRSDRVGHIATTLVEVKKPKRIVKRWNWALPGSGSIVDRPLLLSSDSTVTITVESAYRRGEEPRCVVHLVHEGAPGAWARELEHLWRWHLVARAAVT